MQMQLINYFILDFNPVIDMKTVELCFSFRQMILKQKIQRTLQGRAQLPQDLGHCS